MTGFEKEALRCKSRKRKIVFDTFSVGASVKDGALSAVGAKNCDFVNGTLKTGVGVEKFLLEDGSELALPVTGGVDSLFLWRTAGSNAPSMKTAGAITEDGSVWFFNLAAKSWKWIRTFKGRMRAISARDGEGENLLILYGGAGAFACRFSGSTQQIYPYAVSGACVCQGRLFLATDGKKIVYSTPYQPTYFAASIDDGGAVELPTDLGKIVEIVSFQNAVCVLYEYGLGRLEIAGSARDFRFEKIGYGGGRIVEGSAGVCSVGGEKLFFLAEDGVYVFDGKRVEACCKNLALSPIGHTQVCNHAQFEGKYFVCFVDKNGEKMGVVVDAESGKGYEAFAPLALSSSLGEGLCLENGYVYKMKAIGVLPHTETAEFRVEKLRFGSAKKTLLRGLRFFGKGTFEVFVESGERSKTETLRIVGGEAFLPLRLRGGEFLLKIRLDAGSEISRIEAETETLKNAES